MLSDLTDETWERQTGNWCKTRYVINMYEVSHLIIKIERQNKQNNLLNTFMLKNGMPHLIFMCHELPWIETILQCWYQCACSQAVCLLPDDWWVNLAQASGQMYIFMTHIWGFEHNFVVIEEMRIDHARWTTIFYILFKAVSIYVIKGL